MPLRSWLTELRRAILPRRSRPLRKRGPQRGFAGVACLEERILPTALILEIGGATTHSYVDADGDAVEIHIAGAAGRAELREAIGDGIGDDDGTPEDGERLGEILISGAAADFAVSVVHRDDLGRGDGTIAIGKIEAIEQVFAGLSGVAGIGESRFELSSFRAAGLSDGGRLAVDEVTGDDGLGIALDSLAAGARVEIAGSVDGRIAVRDDLRGTVTIGGDLASDFTVGGSVTLGTAVLVGGAVSGDVTILGDLSGQFHVGGPWSGDLTIVGNFTAPGRIVVTGSMAGEVEIVGGFHGDVVVGDTWAGRLSVGGTYGFDALIRTGANFLGEARLYGAVLGDVIVGGRTYGKWIVSGAVWETASFIAGVHWTSLHVADNFFGQVVAGESVVLSVDGHVGSTARIGSSASQAAIVTATGVFYGAGFGGASVYVAAAEGLHPEARIVATGTAMIVVSGGLPTGVWVRAASVQVVATPRPAGPGAADTLTSLVIDRPGYYRLARDIVYTGRDGAAIEIRASGVVLDLNGHTIVGTAGSASAAVGIRANNLSDVTVMNGTVSGFQRGVVADGLRSSSCTVQDVRAESNWYIGIWVEGPSSNVRDCQVVNTGGSTYARDYTIPIAIRLVGGGTQLTGSIVAGMKRSPNNIELVALHVDSAPSSLVQGNVFDIGDQTLYDSWGAWVNAGSARQFGLTDVLFDDNIFARSQYGVTYANSDGTHRDNTVLGVFLAFEYDRNPAYLGTDGGGNVQLA